MSHSVHAVERTLTNYTSAVCGSRVASMSALTLFERMAATSLNGMLARRPDLPN